MVAEALTEPTLRSADSSGFVLKVPWRGDRPHASARKTYRPDSTTTVPQEWAEFDTGVHAVPGKRSAG